MDIPYLHTTAVAENVLSIDVNMEPVASFQAADNMSQS